MLDTEDVRQTEGHDCGEAAMDTAFRLFGLRSVVVGLATPLDGMHPATIEAVLQKAGMFVQSGRMTVEDLKHHTRLGRPVLCPVSLYGGHWVVVRGVGPKRVHYHCPTDGRRSVSHESWDALWHDVERAGHTFVHWGIATWANPSQQ